MFGKTIKGKLGDLISNNVLANKRFGANLFLIKYTMRHPKMVIFLKWDFCNFSLFYYYKLCHCNVKMTSPCHLYVASRHIKDLLEAFFMHFSFQFKWDIMWWAWKRIHNLCEDGIDKKSVPNDHYLWTHDGNRFFKIDFSILPSHS